MKGFLEAIVLLFVIKGILYALFPTWIQRFIAENIINTPINRLKVFGVIQLFLALGLWIIIKKHFMA
ncbi:MAG: DUF2065 family protein [Alphaproteobacteria bacterium]